MAQHMAPRTIIHIHAHPLGGCPAAGAAAAPPVVAPLAGVAAAAPSPRIRSAALVPYKLTETLLSLIGPFQFR